LFCLSIKLPLEDCLTALAQSPAQSSHGLVNAWRGAACCKGPWFNPGVIFTSRWIFMFIDVFNNRNGDWIYRSSHGGGLTSPDVTLPVLQVLGIGDQAQNNKPAMKLRSDDKY
jgi:hypothetical protein